MLKKLWSVSVCVREGERGKRGCKREGKREIKNGDFLLLRIHATFICATIKTHTHTHTHTHIYIYIYIYIYII